MAWMASEERWNPLFSKCQGVVADLAKQALVEHEVDQAAEIWVNAHSKTLEQQSHWLNQPKRFSFERRPAFKTLKLRSNSWHLGSGPLLTASQALRPAPVKSLTLGRSLKARQAKDLTPCLGKGKPRESLKLKANTKTHYQFLRQ